MTVRDAYIHLTNQDGEGKVNKYSATFSDGTTIMRGTNRIYGFAWRATWTSEDGRLYSPTGFAASASKVNALKPVKYLVHNRMSSAERSEKRRLNEEYCDAMGYRVEVVPTVLLG